MENISKEEKAVSAPSIDRRFKNKDSVMAQVVRKVGLKDYRAAAATLADAFRHDHVMRYMIDTPDMAGCSEEDKFKIHTSIFEALVLSFVLGGLVTTVGDEFGSVALWLPPGADTTKGWIHILSGLWKLKYKLSSEGNIRWDEEFNPLLLKTKTEMLRERDNDSYYLVYIGTKKEAQGKGYGRKLIEDVTFKADQEGRCCYLESSADANLAFYTRCGFEDVGTIKLVRAKVPVEMKIMIREPLRSLSLSSSEGKSF